MTETTRIADQLKRAFEGSAWSGPSVMETLSGVSSADAARHAAGEAHSIWEIVLHIATWEGVVLRRLGGDPAKDITPQQDFPTVIDISEQAWANTLSSLKEGHEALIKGVLGLPQERLSSIVPSHDYTFYVMLHGVVQHDLYHAGQIAILKRLAATSGTAARA